MATRDSRNDQQNHDKCLYPEKWAQIDEQLRTILTEVTQIKTSLQDLHDRTFVDNGKPSHQTRLQLIETKVSAIIWVITAIGAALTASIVHSVYALITKQ